MGAAALHGKVSNACPATAAAASHLAALVRGRDGKGPDAGHGIQHNFAGLEEVHQPLVLALQP